MFKVVAVKAEDKTQQLGYEPQRFNESLLQEKPWRRSMNSKKGRKKTAHCHKYPCVRSNKNRTDELNYCCILSCTFLGLGNLKNSPKGKKKNNQTNLLNKRPTV